MSIILNNVCLSLHQNEILKNITLSIEKGALALFFGKSGSGKTTLLRALAGLNELSAGSILKNPSSVRLGLVSQTFDLFPHMTVRKNCVQPQRVVLKKSLQEAEKKAVEILKLLDMEGYTDRYPETLSGGQKQRVAIARSLSLGACILLFDEPTSALDPGSVGLFLDLVKQLRKQGLTVVISTHDMSFTSMDPEYIFLMEQGTIVDTFEKSKEKVLSTGSPLFRYVYPSGK